MGSSCYFFSCLPWAPCPTQLHIQKVSVQPRPIPTPLLPDKPQPSLNGTSQQSLYCFPRDWFYTKDRWWAPPNSQEQPQEPNVIPVAQVLQELAHCPQNISPFLSQRAAGSSRPLPYLSAKLVTQTLVLYLGFVHDSLGGFKQRGQVEWSHVA
jgi:hypothetical protein